MWSATANQKVPGRECGSCTLCCKVMGITELKKPAGKWCSNCSPGEGCKIYSARPEECRSFMCGWLTQPELGPEWKPDKAKMVLKANPDGSIAIRCDPGHPDAWRRSPYRETILRWCEAARAHGGIVVACVRSKMTLIAVEGEFPLGDVGDDETIVGEFSGSRLIGAKVVKRPPQ